MTPRKRVRPQIIAKESELLLEEIRQLPVRCCEEELTVALERDLSQIVQEGQGIEIVDVHNRIVEKEKPRPSRQLRLLLVTLYG